MALSLRKKRIMEDNKTYRIRTKVGGNEPYNLSVALDQEYTTFDILSMKITDSDSYRLHNSAYGVIAGRVNANGGFGIPNAKISLFVEMDYDAGDDIRKIYPYVTVGSSNGKGVRYNLLPDNKVDDCHQIIGTFPNKTYMLDNDVLMEVFDKYYKFTTRTNGSGDYMLCGVPVGNYTLHMDLDLSDCGILSQRPRDFVYKGYTIEQFENPNQFKTGTELDSLSQVISQDTTVTVNPFWGSGENGETIGITRADIDVAFKFEPTCVFMGSVVSDAVSNGVSKECIPTDNMGAMDEMVTGEGTIEMIRKTPGGDVESFEVKGTQLINADGVWCYQIPMNLDYMVTDEYGNMVPTDDPDKGVATRARVRFRVSLQESSDSLDGYYRAKVLVPNNPQLTDVGHEEYDYNFGTNTRDDSYRDLFWNNVYSVKSYIPRFGKSTRWKTEKFSGIKHCNIHGNNNPIPYDNIRIKLPFMFTLLCALIKTYIRIAGFINILKNLLLRIVIVRDRMANGKKNPGANNNEPGGKYVVIADGLCPDLEGWYFAPKAIPKRNRNKFQRKYWNNTFNFICGEGDIDADPDFQDNQSIDYKGGLENDSEGICLTTNIDYLMACIEMNLAQEYKVINFDFYNDWINGTLYIPRWKRYIKRKRSFFIFGKKIEKVKGCMDDKSIFSKTRRYMQLCSLKYTSAKANDGSVIYSRVNFDNTNKYHKKYGLKYASIFGDKGGLVHEAKTMYNQNVYYLKPCEWRGFNKKVNLFATDVILLGSLNTCDQYGVPQMFKYLSSSSYKMPTNLALTNMDTDGPLYATKNGTTCTGKNNFGNDSGGYGIRLVNGTGENTTFNAEINYWKGTDNAVLYGDDSDVIDYSDTMPITEAAGISWNYSGPGQGKNDPDKMYYPGGHFLGISCVNSQTNIKSCVNLSRICELGTTMSERKEIVRKVMGKEDGTEYSIQYTYNVPTGLISKDEIIESDARTMFASMNHKRLIATRLNENTGYYTYDFDYLQPDGFNGELYTSVFGKGTSPYNADVTDAKDESIPNVSAAKNRGDYDPYANANTQRRTLENTESSYYLFRFGLDNSNIYNANVTKNQKRRFLREDDSSVYLPQYENSFYFYFGLHDGATALDEFNKQFFSVCSHETTLRKAETLIVESSSSAATLTGEITIDMEGLYPPFSVKVFDDNNNEIGNVSETEETILKFVTEFGAYTVTVEDGKGVSYSSNVVVGADSISGEMKPYHFNMVSPVMSGQWYYGGFIGVSDIFLKGVDMDKVPVKIYVAGSNAVSYSKGSMSEIYVSQPGEYEVYLEYNAGYGTKKPLLGKCIIMDSSSAKLMMGDNGMLSVYDDMPDRWYLKNWWNDIEGSASSQENAWKLKHSIFNQKNESEGVSTFDSKVMSNGNRYYFGNVQSPEMGIDDSAVYSSVDASYGNIPDGYYLSDKSSYWQTVNETTSHEPFGSVPVYNNTIVGGNVCAYIDGKTGASMDVKIVNNTLFQQIKGYGCVVKERWTNQIEVARITDEGKIVFDEEKIEKYYGTIYPMFFYPSIYRPFYANVLFTTTAQIGVEISPSDNNIFMPNVINRFDNCKTEMELYNGITYNGAFDSASTSINGINNVVINRSKNDTEGITVDSAKEKIERLYGSEAFYQYPWVIESGFNGTYRYQIGEGAPESYTELINLLNGGELSPSFFDNVLWEKSGEKYKFYGTSQISSDTSEDEDEDETTTGNIEKYYLIDSSDILTYENKVVGNLDNNIYYIVGKYNSKATENNSGERCIVEIEGDTARFSLLQNGVAVQKVVKGTSGNDESSIYAGFNEVLSQNGVTLDRRVNALWNQPDSNNRHWIERIREKINNGTEISINDNKTYSFNPDKQIIIGFAHYINGIGYSDIVRVYAYATEGIQYSVGGLTYFLKANPLSFNMSATGGTQAITVESNVDWNVRKNANWVTIDKTSASGNGVVNVVIAPNDTTETRMTTLVLSSDSTDDITVTITQDENTE